jgi:uncharacterized oxidoreductase
MQLTNKTILITGGTSGIGFELARRLLERRNVVIITGRDQTRLDAAGSALSGVETIRSDVSDPQSIAELHANVAAKYPMLDVLINNAGVMRKLDLQDASRGLDDVTREIETNLSGPIRMVQQFLPLLKAQPSATIINVSSGLAFVPLAISPVYSATKAGLHAYTLSLRLQLQRTKVAVFELAPPGTDTDLFHGGFTAEDLKGMQPMDVKVMVERALKGIENETFEIRPGLSNMLKWMSRIAPGFITKQLGRGVERMGV